MKVRISKYDIDRLLTEYESCQQAGFEPEEEIIFPFWGIGYSRISMKRCKELIEKGKSLMMSECLEVEVEMFNN